MNAANVRRPGPRLPSDRPSQAGSLLGAHAARLPDKQFDLSAKTAVDDGGTLSDPAPYGPSDARELSGARYAALGVPNEGRTELERFITAGMDEETRKRIGALPMGRGVLGELIEHPVPLRLVDVEATRDRMAFRPTTRR